MPSSFVDWVASCFEGASRGVVILWIPEWSSWSRWRRAATLYPGGSETVLMIFTGSLWGIYRPTKKEARLGAIKCMWGNPCYIWAIKGTYMSESIYLYLYKWYYLQNITFIYPNIKSKTYIRWTPNVVLALANAGCP